MKKINLLSIAFICILASNLQSQQDLLCSIGNLNSGGTGSPNNRVAHFNGDVYGGSHFSLKRIFTDNSFVSTGAPGGVNALMNFDGKLFVACDQLNIATYNTSNNILEQNVGSLDGTVNSLAVINDELYAGGRFTGGVAKWNGSTNWEVLGDGLNGTPSSGHDLQVNELIEYNGDIVATGRFRFSGTTRVNSLARWDGTSWHPFGEGLGLGDPNHPEGIGRGLAVFNNKLIVHGNFHTVDENNIPSIAVWDGVSWSGLTSDPTWPNNNNLLIFDMITLDGFLYLAGEAFIEINNNTYHIAAWDGAQWHGIVKVDPEFAWVRDIEPMGDDRLIIGGNFSQANDFDPDEFILTGAITDLFTCSTLSVEESLFNDIKIYPNPIESILKIQSEITIDNIKIYSLQGQLIKQASDTEIDVSNLSSGIYFVSISSDGKTITKKFVKQP